MKAPATFRRANSRRRRTGPVVAALLMLSGCVTPPPRVLDELRAPHDAEPDHYRRPPPAATTA